MQTVPASVPSLASFIAAMVTAFGCSESTSSSDAALLTFNILTPRNVWDLLSIQILHKRHHSQVFRRRSFLALQSKVEVYFIVIGERLAKFSWHEHVPLSFFFIAIGYYHKILLENIRNLAFLADNVSTISCRLSACWLLFKARYVTANNPSLSQFRTSIQSFVHLLSTQHILALHLFGVRYGLCKAFSILSCQYKCLGSN